MESQKLSTQDAGEIGLSSEPTHNPDGTPSIVIARAPIVIRDVRVATTIGETIFALGWPRRAIADRLQTRLDYFLDHGGRYLTRDMEPLAIHEDSIEETFGDDPLYTWLSSFPKRCHEKRLERMPAERLAPRLTMLDLALRTPRLGLAI